MTVVVTLPEAIIGHVSTSCLATSHRISLFGYQDENNDNNQNERSIFKLLLHFIYVYLTRQWTIAGLKFELENENDVQKTLSKNREKIFKVGIPATHLIP